LQRLLPALLALALIAAFAGCGGGDDDSASDTADTTSASLSSCDISGRQQDLGASYVTTIQVAEVSCRQAEEVVVAYHACRQQNGGAGGSCDTAAMGFECTEGQRQEVPGVQFNATADCRKGDAQIRSSYTQNF
jgi:hypothetical protein